jgi:hypothetical protein
MLFDMNRFYFFIFVNQYRVLFIFLMVRNVLLKDINFTI